MIAGVELPDSALCRAAAAYAKQVSEPPLFHHVQRTYVFGALLAGAQKMRFDREVFYVAALLHDLGLTDAAPLGARFEIAGADAAKALLTREGMAERDVELVWDAIAMHTTLGLPTRKRPEVALVQLGAGIDVGYLPIDAVAAALPQILEAWPRLGFKEALPGYLLRTYERDPGAALGSPIVAEVVERKLGIRGPNACDVIARARFSD